MPEGSRRPTGRSADVVLRYGDDLVARSVSPASLPVLGHPPEQLTGLGLTGLVHPEDLDALAAHARGAVSGEPAPPVAARFRHRDGHWVWLGASVDPGGRAGR